MSIDEFQLLPGKSPHTIVPLEPLYSMLHDAPIEAVNYLQQELSRLDSEKDLEEILPNLGITRRKALEQILLVMSQREQE